MKKIIQKKKFFSILAVLLSFVMASSAFPAVEGNGGLSADFTWEPAEPTDLQEVHFHDNSSGAIVWIWDFGDGNSSCDTNPVHIYADDGTYTVRLTVWDEHNSMDTITKSITVHNVPPVADAGGDRILNNRTVKFNASASYDGDGSIVSYSWNFDDGHTASGISVTHTYENDGIYNVLLNVTDNDGEYDTVIAHIMVDTLSPVTNITLNGTLGTNNWYRGNVEVSLNATDNLSGVNKTLYKIGDEWIVYNNSFNITVEGENELQYYSIDEAGNSESIHSVDIKIDNTSPETNFSVNGTMGEEGWYVGKVNVTFNASDPLSGIAFTKYKVDDGDWKNYSGTFTVGSNGTHTIYFYSADNAGNVESEKNFTIKIDRKPPSVSLTAPKDGYLYIFGREILPTAFGKTKIIGKFTAAATASDTLSGIRYVNFKLDGDLLWMDFNSPYQVELPHAFPRGVHTLKVTAYDNAGNSASTGELTYIKIF